MTTVIKHCRGEKTKIDGFRNNVFRNGFRNVQNLKLNQKQGKSLKNNPLEEYTVKFYKIDYYFYKHYKKKNAS